MSTVFFGPFIGEFGWELVYWHGWVRAVCRGQFRQCRKIAASFPGRQVFYPEVDEFWSHPPEIPHGTISSMDYRTDNWRRGFRSDDGLVVGEEYAHQLLEHYKDRLADNTVRYIVPWQWNSLPELGMEFGIRCPADAKSDSDMITKGIPFSVQKFDYLYPTSRGLQECRAIVPADQPLLAVFPRNRIHRRPDKNWVKESYEWLIEKLQREYPQYVVGLFGEPGGAYFADAIPAGCLDFIHLDPAVRTDVHVAALKQTKLALGSMSGAILFALACGTPSITWGWAETEARYHQENYMKTPFHYVPNILPSVEWVFAQMRQMLGDLAAQRYDLRKQVHEKGTECLAYPL